MLKCIWSIFSNILTLPHPLPIYKKSKIRIKIERIYHSNQQFTFILHISFIDVNNFVWWPSVFCVSMWCAANICTEYPWWMQQTEYYQIHWPTSRHIFLYSPQIIPWWFGLEDKKLHPEQSSFNNETRMSTCLILEIEPNLICTISFTSHIKSVCWKSHYFHINLISIPYQISVRLSVVYLS